MQPGIRDCLDFEVAFHEHPDYYFTVLPPPNLGMKALGLTHVAPLLPDGRQLGIVAHVTVAHDRVVDRDGFRLGYKEQPLVTELLGPRHLSRLVHRINKLNVPVACWDRHQLQFYLVIPLEARFIIVKLFWVNGSVERLTALITSLSL